MVKAGYDIDGVLMPTMQLALDIANEMFNRDYRIGDCTDPFMEKSFRMTREEGRRVFRYASEEGLLLKLKPIVGSRRVINKYSKKFDQYFVTARGSRMRKETLQWFTLNEFQYKPKNVIFGQSTPMAKAGKVKKLGLDFFVEDTLANANAIAEEARINVYLIDYPWNREQQHDFVKRVYSWREIEQDVQRKFLHPFY